MFEKTLLVLTLIFFILGLAACGQQLPQPAVDISQVPASSSPATLAQPNITAAPTAEGSTAAASAAVAVTYAIVDTGQGQCYDNRAEITCPQAGAAFYGQDAQFSGSAPSYTLSTDGLTVQDNVSGLTWQRSPDTSGDGALNKSDKLTLAQAQALPAQLNTAAFGGYSDWRLPSIKELYSLINFTGSDPSGGSGTVALTPFIDTTYFQFAYGDAQSGERTIDSQFASSTLYIGPSARGGAKLFGVNFADGRIKGYDLSMPGGSEKTFFVLCVRGSDQYGINQFVDNGDQTITDQATGLTWAKADSGSGMNWQEALAWVQAQNAANALGHNDWRLPDAKELQSILDYARSPDTTNSAAINAVFDSTSIRNEAGQNDYPAYWSSTTHASSNGSGGAGVYVAFGRALGYMDNAWVDVHGAGAQRSDPKSGDASQFPQGRGPQGDAIRIDNYVRLVRGGNVTAAPEGSPASTLPSMEVEVTSDQMNQPQDAAGQAQPPALGGMPPQAALDACSASTQGAACSFEAPPGTVSGTCQAVQRQLACVPANHPAQP